MMLYLVIHFIMVSVIHDSKTDHYSYKGEWQCTLMQARILTIFGYNDQDFFMLLEAIIAIQRHTGV